VAENLRKIRDRWRDSRASFALSQTLRPVAVRLRSFSLVYPLSIVALSVSGTALYLSRPLPSESMRVSAAATSDDVTASEGPPSSTAPDQAASDVPSIANKADVVRSPAASSSAVQSAARRKTTTKPAASR